MTTVSAGEGDGAAGGVDGQSTIDSSTVVAVVEVLPVAGDDEQGVVDADAEARSSRRAWWRSRAS